MVLVCLAAGGRRDREGFSFGEGFTSNTLPFLRDHGQRVGARADITAG
jgi:hypothetical protein